MWIDPQHYQDESEKQLQDTIPAAELDIDDPTVRAPHDATVDLTARRLGSEILVQGEINVTLETLCGRCADWLPWPVQVRHFAVSLAVTNDEPIDLTPSLREDILLALPVVTSCTLDAQFRCAHNGQVYPPEQKKPTPLHEDVWSALDKIKPKTKD
jgi:uncharacterized metal-binding protein YceD (DUF177 family)